MRWPWSAPEPTSAPEECVHEWGDWDEPTYRKMTYTSYTSIGNAPTVMDLYCQERKCTRCNFAQRHSI